MPQNSLSLNNQTIFLWKRYYNINKTSQNKIYIAGNLIDHLLYNINNIFLHYSNSTKTNAFCLGIILCNVSRSFDYLIYPYYPAYTS